MQLDLFNCIFIQNTSISFLHQNYTELQNKATNMQHVTVRHDKYASMGSRSSSSSPLLPIQNGHCKAISETLRGDNSCRQRTTTLPGYNSSHVPTLNFRIWISERTMNTVHLKYSHIWVHVTN